MDSTARNEERNKVFQKLKPCCVKISQLALRQAQDPSTQEELLSLTGQLLSTLEDQVRTNPLALDEKLAEYVFFPLYHVFRQIDLFPMRLIENCIKSLTILVLHGWKSKISPEMVKQVLSLLTFIIDGVPGSSVKREPDEETVLEAYRGFTALFNVASQSVTAAAGLAESDVIPALGHAITVMLDGVDKGPNSSVSVEALRSLQGVYTAIRDQGALANFLPGSISILTKVLSAPARYKKAVLTKCLSTVSLILTRVLGDMSTRSIRFKAERKEDNETENENKNALLSPAWLAATVSQVKLALTSMMKLRNHDEPDVRDALRGLCMKLLDECHETLSVCSGFLVEAAIVLDDPEAKSSLTETSLRDLISIYPELGDEAKKAVYNWLSSLSRLMQGSDEDTKSRALHSLSKGFKLLQDLQIESSTLEDTMTNTLLGGLVSVMSGPKSQALIHSTEIELFAGSGSLVAQRSRELQYPPLILNQESQRGVRAEMNNLIGVLGSRTGSSSLAATLLELVQSSGSVNQVAALWACFELIKSAHHSTADATALFDLSSFAEDEDDIDVVFHELYSFSVQILDAYSNASPVDWRLEAIALEVTSYAASRSKAAFRPELIDVLFPVVTFLGSENPNLQQHGIVTLNKLASACEYDSVSELIVDNVDYMVNSVALRLNSLDISPASTQVLTMMIRLAGSRLVPFLDDVVESIFAALENYHGYPLFVESLFSVLQELVHQAVKSDMLLLEHQKDSSLDHKKKPLQVDGLKGLSDFISRRQTRQQRELQEKKTSKPVGGHPTTPWADDDPENKDEEMAPPEPEKEKPPNSVTYQLLLRITNLTQHYLTSPIPRLRRSLLDVLSTASPALAADEEAFLPLVNAIWPVVVERLYDSETYIAIEACHALSELCSSAGDFLSSRFETEWAERLGAWSRTVKRAVQASGSSLSKRPTETTVLSSGGDNDGGSQILVPTSSGEVKQLAKTGPGQQQQQPTSGGGGLGQHASPVRLWEALVTLLKAMVSHVKLTEQVFEDILTLLAEVLERSSEVRSALEVVNADAVWLLRYDRGLVNWIAVPQVEGMKFAEMQPQIASS